MTKVCFYCGHGMPEELKDIPLQGATQWRIFLQLYSAMGDTISHEQLASSKAVCYVHIHRIQHILKDAGVPFMIIMDRGAGYYMERRR